MPLLEVDGEVLAQSMTIARFAARECGLAGSNSLAAAKADMAADATTDIRNSEFLHILSSIKLKIDKILFLYQSSISGSLRVMSPRRRL